MRDGRLGDGFHVVGDDVVAAVQRGVRLAGAIEGQRAARRSAEVDVRMRPVAFTKRTM
jgi:hypothetical protein